MLGRYGDLGSSGSGAIDVLDFANRAAFPQLGEEDKIYIALDTDIAYSFTGTTYTPLGNMVFKNTKAEFPVIGESNMTYLDKSTRILYEWNGSSYEQIGEKVVGWVYFEEQKYADGWSTDTPTLTLTAKEKLARTDIAIAPINRGALVIDKTCYDTTDPDNWIPIVGERGNNALDFQRNRDDFKQIAVGDSSIILGGQRNTASSKNTVIVCGTHNRCDSENGFILNGINNVISMEFTPFDDHPQ